GEALLHALKEAGARALFGIPGDYVLPFFEIIEKSRILPLYTFSHEPAVGYAADAAARYGAGVGVAVVTYGAGALSMVNAAACAWAERSPLVIISGAPGTNEHDQGLLLHHQIRQSGSQLRIFEELTCARTVIDDPAKAPKEIARVLRAALRHSRPVYIELPRNVVQAACQTPQLRQSESYDETAAQDCARTIGRLLAGAKKPAILADVEVRRFGLEEAVAALAEQAGIPLMTTFMGKGMFAGRGTACLGTYLGAAGDPVLSDIIENADCLLMLGVIACDTNLGMAGKKIDLANAVRMNEGCTHAGGRKFENVGLASLIYALQKILPARVGERPRLPISAAAKTPMLEGARPLVADDIAGIINAQLENAPRMPLAVDVGDCLFISMGVRDVPLLASGYYATMGFGVPAGLGVQAATGERPLIIVGDGGFQMTGWELLNCARSGLDPVVLVLNNGGWGMLKQMDPQAGYVLRDNISYAALAEMLGGVGYRAATPGELATYLKTAFGRRGRFQMIEAVLPRGEVSTTLKQYVAALRSGMQRQAAA
ncbi:MAG: indolepyruvate/phenylpyruvate decarboxylase, partial [Alphaproteobacteria bacterium]